MKIIFKPYLILMIIIVYQVAKMMERTQILPDRIDRNVQEEKLITLRPVYLIMKVVIRRIIWIKIIHLHFIGKTVLTTFECVTVRYILHYHIGH